MFLWAIAAMFLWLFLWAAFSQVDERVRGAGQVMPMGDVQVVLERCDEIPRTANGKFRAVICEIPPAERPRRER